MSKNNIIIKARAVSSDQDWEQYCWGRLTRFQDEAYTLGILKDRHQLSKKFDRSLRKQAVQIKFSLMQAKEYFDASKVVSLATQPVLLYYCLTSLATAEILLKQTGDQSIDKARAEHGHHGLRFTLKSQLKREHDLRASASRLHVKPHIVKNERKGLYSLWSQSAREHPLIGESRYQLLNGGILSDIRVLLSPDTKPITKISTNGVNLLECFCDIARLSTWLSDYNIESNYVRGDFTLFGFESQPLNQYRLAIHPTKMQRREKLEEMIKFETKGIEYSNIIYQRAGESAFTLSWQADLNFIYGLRIPSAVHQKKNTSFFFLDDKLVNEFDAFYRALFGCGMYARYYPDEWMRDIQESNPLSLTIRELLYLAYERLPILCLSELETSFSVMA